MEIRNVVCKTCGIEFTSYCGGYECNKCVHLKPLARRFGKARDNLRNLLDMPPLNEE